MTSNLGKNHIIFPPTGYYQIRNKRFASVRFPRHADKGRSALVLLIALVLFGVALGALSKSRMLSALQSAFNSPALRAYANEQGDGSDSLILPGESQSGPAGSSGAGANP